MLRCYNRGCGQEYDPEKNTDDSCRHHPGAPFFHDAYKGWSCCNKKSVDFTEFLNIKGCTLSKHSNVKPPEPIKPIAVDKEEKQKVVEVRAPIREPLARPPFNTPMIEIQPTVAPALKELIENVPTKSNTNSNNDIESDSTVSIGTLCKNSGCNYSYTGTTADNDECQYHSGIPIFHEGMKYWSCCQRKTTDFAVFMSQKGCMYGQHKWHKDNNDKNIMQCRYDWHQTATNVILSIYAKKYHYAKSKIEVNPIRLHVTLLFPDQNDAIYDLDLELRGIINTEKTTAHMLGSKIEITLPKAEPGTWPKLDFPQKVAAQSKAHKVEQISNAKEKKDANEDDDDFNLDDVNIIDRSAQVSEIST